MDETQEKGPEGPGPSAPGDQPRLINLIVVAGAIVLIGLVAVALYRHAHPATPPPAAGPSPAGEATPPTQGTPISAAVPVRLTPEAAIVAERYRCVCSCRDPLNVCTCSKTPGSRDMRQYVQDLVNQKKTTREIDAAMVARYGADALIAPSAPAPTPTPSRTSRRKH